MIQRKLKVFAMLGTLFFGASCAHKEMDQSMAKDGLNLNVKKVVLDNGLRVLIYENHKLPIFSYYTFFDVGGRYEEGGTTGATHFLEHMMFKGAKKYGPRQFDTFIESNGGSTNAYTTFDNTVYYESLPSHTIEKVVDMEADRFQHLLLEKQSFEKERQVVLEERKMRYENSDRGKLYLSMMKEVFQGTPYGGSVIGDKKDVENLNRDQMREFFKRFYTPDNAIIVIAGDVDADDTIKMIKDKFGDIKKSEGLKEYKAKKDDPKRYEFKTKFNRSVRIKGQSKDPTFFAAYKGVPIGSRKAYAMDILASIIGQGESSYLNQKWVKSNRPKLAGVYAANYTLKNNGVFYIWGKLLNKVSLRSFKKDLSRTMRSICKNSISERTLQKTKNKYLVYYYNNVQSNSDVASFLGDLEFYYGDYKHYKKELDIINSIEVNEVKEVCKEVLSKNERIFVSIWDKHPKR